MLNTLLTQLGIELPIIQAPMAGTSTAALAAAVSNAGEAAASQHECYDFAPFWAGQSAPLARELGAAELVALLATEWKHASLNSF